MSAPPIQLPPESISGPSREECDYLLGVYIRTWGDVEGSVANLISKLLDTDTITSRIVIRALGNMMSQREIASELGRHRLRKQDFDLLEKLLERVKSAATRRNRIVHGYWMMHIQMGDIPNTKPLTAKSAKWVRMYDPSQRDEYEKLMTGKHQKLNSAYQFWPDDLKREIEKAVALAKSIDDLTKVIVLQSPRIPLPVEW
jgi:hypothetical protein